MSKPKTAEETLDAIAAEMQRQTHQQAELLRELDSLGRSIVDLTRAIERQR
ncbi:hypothetical protein [Amycolatopsis sp. VC5-11]|uniref:hypothetical protein n=1 Tax=Amycolatopsis sp. VC5-11 TaxID=3120156 RepID=UPI00300A0549